MALEGFSDLIRRLNDAHEQEVEGLREKVQELTNKKGGSDVKRMEELFNRNQHLREQQRLLTDNIKQLENRLRAGLCDRCTVTQDMARRRQQEYETSQIQTLQHISILATEVTLLKRENKRLRDGVRNLRGAVGGQSSSSYQEVTSEVKSRVDLSPPAVPPTPSACRSGSQPPEGASAMKTEPEQRESSAGEGERRDGQREQPRGWREIPVKSLKLHPLVKEAPPLWRAEPGGAPVRARERRTQSAETINQQRPSISLTIPSHLLLPRSTHPSPPPPSSSSSSSSSRLGEERASRHPVLVPVPYRPQPHKVPCLTLPWPLTEPPDWASGEGLSPSSKPSSPCFPARPPSSHPQQPHQRAQGKSDRAGQGWPLHSPPASQAGPPVGLFLRMSAELGDRGGKAWEGKVAPPCRKGTVVQPEKVIGDVLGETPMTEGPLDLSDHGKSKTSQSPSGIKSHPALQERSREEETSNNNLTCPSSSPSSSSSSSSSGHPNNESQEEESSGKVNLSTQDKKVPVLSLSVRPVVLLENLNISLKKQEVSNGMYSHAGVQSGQSDPISEEDGGEQILQGTKRTREDLEIDPETQAVQKERKVRLSPVVTEHE